MIVIAIETGWNDRNIRCICQDSHFWRFFHVKISLILVAEGPWSQPTYHGLSCQLYFQSQFSSWPISCSGQVSLQISAPATLLFTLIYGKTLPRCARDTTCRTIGTSPSKSSRWDKFLLSAAKREISRGTISCSSTFGSCELGVYGMQNWDLD
jgi:hypothetical protein